MNQFTFFPGGARAVNAESDVQMLAKAASGNAADIVIAKTADVSEAKSNSTATKVVQFFLTDSAGNVHTWYNKSGVTIAATPSAGAIVMTPTGVANASFVNGVCTVSCAINAACHNNAGANTIVITAPTICGVQPSGATLTHTITYT